MVLRARPWHERDPSRLMAWSLLGAIVLHSLLEYPLWYGPFQLVFGLCLGILWPARMANAVRLAPSRLGAGGVVAAAGAALLIAIVCYAAWDYTRISQIYLDRDKRLAVYRNNPLAEAKSSWLFADSVAFAELTLTPVGKANAAELHALAQRVLHFSPEPRVVVKLIDSAKLLGREDEVLAQVARFKAAYPHEYERWRSRLPTDDPSE
jgi:hypothetical protein